MGLRIKKVAVVLGLLAIGLFAASPFLHNRMVGTGEAFNYSLSVADAVTQMRAGVVPPLAGQTLYAFNGRIHPLRDGPYLHYLAYALDTVTLRHLELWQLQTYSLALSVMAAIFACYIALRWGTGCSRWLAFVFSAFYGLSPPLLGAAYSFDLYMTVHAAVFVPLAIGACVRGCLRPSFSADAWLAAALAAAWLAHPPVAFWLTAAVVFVRTLVFVRNPDWRTLGRGVCAAALAGVLGSFVFISVHSLQFGLTTMAGGDNWRPVADLIVKSQQDTFPASALPVTRHGSASGDIQFGYVPWILLAISLVGVVRIRRRRVEGEPRVWWVAAGLLIASSTYLALVFPIPVVNPWLWRHVPNLALQVTSIWPSQRLYLIAIPCTFFAAAVVLPMAFGDLRLPRGSILVAIAACAAWTMYEAVPFIGRGNADRWTSDFASSSYRPSNLDLTVTSYAFLDTPRTFVYGVIDPQFEFRLLRNGSEEIGSTMASGLSTAPVVARGKVDLYQVTSITLQPAKRYLITFNFHTPPAHGYLNFLGPLIKRTYVLPSAGSPAGFGMIEGARRSIPIWTDGNRPEKVEIRFDIDSLMAGVDTSVVFADYTLQEVNPATLPVQLEGLLPMRFGVDSPEMGCTVETPRRFLGGYEATVNGEPVTPLSSPDRQVMVPVPKGHSEVILSYRGPLVVRATFWICLAAWICFAVWRLTGSWIPADPLGSVARPVFGAFHLARRNKLSFCATALVVAAIEYGFIRYSQRQSYLNAVGPIQVAFKLPYNKLGVNEPLVATGQVGAGVIVFVTCLNETHVRLSADVWGRLYQSGPVELDFSRTHTLVVAGSALFPADHPRISAITPDEVKQLRADFRAEIDGATVLHEPTYAYETKQSEILAGRSNFGSLNEPLFSGEILGVKRLPIPRSVVLPWGYRANLTIRFPTGREGYSEPIVSSNTGDHRRSLFVTYLADNRARFTWHDPYASSLHSADVAIDPSKDHLIEFAMGESKDNKLAAEVACSLDGSVLFGSQVLHRPADSPPTITTGFDDSGVPGLVDRFTGSKLNLSIIANNPEPGSSDSNGPLDLIVTFPVGRTGHGEPLIASGRAGAGDIVYVFYTDAAHVKIGLDHWGHVGATSEPIAVDYQSPHEFWIELNSLNSQVGQRAKSTTSVIMDGTPILSSGMVAYPSEPIEISIGKNSIGASTAEPAFTGVIHFAERLASGTAPKTGS